MEDLPAPNIDGTKGVGGCTYCSHYGSGDFAGNPLESLPEQFEQVKQKMHQNGRMPAILAIFRHIPIHMPHWRN